MAYQLSKLDKVRLEQWIGEEAKTFALIYSINNHGCSPAVFHELCNNKGPTVTVLYNTNGSVFGGYTSISWRGSNSYQFDHKAFLFRLRYSGNPMYTKFPIKGGYNAIYDQSESGPFFGEGHDLGTFNTTLKKWQNQNHFAFSHGMTINNSYDFRNVQAKEINNGHTKIAELQVYQVKDGPHFLSLEPWRAMPEWDQGLLESLKDDVQNFVPMEELKISQANILLIGPVSAGKSSFFNTVNSIFRGYVTSQACSGRTTHSVTTKYCMFQVCSSASSKPLPFRLCDTRGLEELFGWTKNDFSFIINGNVPDGHEFSSYFSERTPGFINKPQLKDRIHCIAFVMDGSTIDALPVTVLTKMREMQEKMNQINLPQVVLLTNVDKVCHNVEEDLSLIFKSGLISNLVDKVSQVMGLPRGHVLPVKNYEKELELDDKVSILSLLALRQILRFSQDFMFNFLDNADRLDKHKLEMKD